MPPLNVAISDLRGRAGLRGERCQRWQRRPLVGRSTIELNIAVLPFRAKRPPILRCEGRDRSLIEQGTISLLGTEPRPRRTKAGVSGAVAQRGNRGLPPNPLIHWWARQPPYEAVFLKGFRGLIKMLIQRVPTKIPTKLLREEDRSAAPTRSRQRRSGRPLRQIELRRWLDRYQSGKHFLRLVRHGQLDCRCHGGLYANLAFRR